MTLPTTPSAAFTTLHTDAQDGVLTITLDNPPLNAFSATTMRELRDLLTGLRSEATIKVIVLQSANPDLFIAHVDMNILEQADVFADVLASVPAGLNIFQFVSELLRNQPQVSIVKLAGTARGGGAEFVAAADFSFAATETADLGQIESLMGITPGGGATQYLLGKVRCEHRSRLRVDQPCRPRHRARRLRGSHRSLDRRPGRRGGRSSQARTAASRSRCRSIVEHQAWEGLLPPGRAAADGRRPGRRCADRGRGVGPGGPPAFGRSSARATAGDEGAGAA